MKHSGTLFALLSMVLIAALTSCKKENSVLSGEAPTIEVSAMVLSGSQLSSNGQITATDTVDFSINVTAPLGFSAVLIGGSGNSALTAASVDPDDPSLFFLPFRVLTIASDSNSRASFIFVAEDQLGQQSDSLRFNFDIEP